MGLEVVSIGSVGKDVVEAVTEFFMSGRLLRQLNCTFVTVIPKVSRPEFVRDLRPISCCNMVLKVMSKVLVEKIKVHLGDIIFEGQGAFVPGRNLAHNSVVAQDLIASYTQS